MNRDYFKKPIQGNSRSSGEYGRTRIEDTRLDGIHIQVGWFLGLIVLAAIGIYKYL